MKLRDFDAKGIIRGLGGPTALYEALLREDLIGKDPFTGGPDVTLNAIRMWSKRKTIPTRHIARVLDLWAKMNPKMPVPMEELTAQKYDPFG